MRATNVYLLFFMIVPVGAVHGQTIVSGNAGQLGTFNVSWLDLKKPTNFNAGTTIEVRFGSSDLHEIVVRFVPEDCDYAAICEMDCEKIPVVHSVADIIIHTNHTNIKQISFHAGVGGKAFLCDVDGGKMPGLVQVIQH